jgi:branched-chain amino acid transport system permease protein
LDIAGLDQTIFNGLVLGCIYILVSLGLTLILSVMGVAQFAHGEIYMLGAYVVFYLVTGAGINFFLAMIISALVMGFVGVVLYIVFIRPFRRQVERCLIVTLGLMIFLQQGAKLGFGGLDKAIPSPTSGVLTILGITLSWERLTIVLISIILLLALMFFVLKTKIGRAMSATSQDPEVAALQGISVDRVSGIAMFVGSAMAGIAGALVGALFSISPTMGTFAIIKGIAVIILGGLGSIVGAIAGGFILGMIDGVVPFLLSSQMASIFGFLAVILILLFRPQGIAGHE